MADDGERVPPQGELSGLSVVLDVDEPYDLVADGGLTLRGRVVEVTRKQNVDILRIALVSDEPRLPRVRFASASARYHGETVLSLASSIELIVHGNFFVGASAPPASGFIGRLRLDQ